MTPPRFSAGHVVTVFRSTLRDDADEGYDALNQEMNARAASLGGLVEVKSFVADDGERVTIVTFEDRDAHDRWASDPAHRLAQQRGRDAIYATYSIQVADCSRATQFVSGDPDPAG